MAYVCVKRWHFYGTTKGEASYHYYFFKGKIMYAYLTLAVYKVDKNIVCKMVCIEKYANFLRQVSFHPWESMFAYYLGLQIKKSLLIYYIS